MSTNILFEDSVPLSVWIARGTPMSATKRLTTERVAAALFLLAPCGGWRREALSTNIMTYRDPPRDVGHGPVVSMWTSPSGHVARPVE